MFEKVASSVVESLVVFLNLGSGAQLEMPPKIGILAHFSPFSAHAANCLQIGKAQVFKDLLLYFFW